MKVMELSHAMKTFDGELEVIKDISVQVEKGEVLAIIGPSGSGKSTLLRCATFLTGLDAGELSYMGEKAIWNDENGKAVYAKNLNKIRSYFGLVFQNFNLFPHYSVLKNLTDAPVCVAKRNPGRWRRRPGVCWTRWGWRTRRTTTPVSSPAASSSGWPSPGRWP